jgi:hypothetical protein
MHIETPLEQAILDRFFEQLAGREDFPPSVLQRLLHLRQFDQNLRESFADYSLYACCHHRFPYQLTDDNLQTPASAALSGEVNT